LSGKEKRNSEILADYWEKPTLPSGSVFEVFEAGAVEDGIILRSIEVRESVNGVGSCTIEGIVTEIHDDLTTHLTRWFESRGCIVEMMRVDANRNVRPIWVGRTPIAMQQGSSEIRFVTEVRNFHF
jgi:hypothetical protein